jgi:hypothetical protein
MTKLQEIFLILSMLVVFSNNSGCTAQKDPIFVIGRKCRTRCNGSRRLRLICRQGQQWCVSASSWSQRGDYCGCCRSIKPPTTCHPTPPRPVSPPYEIIPTPVKPPLQQPYPVKPPEGPVPYLPTGGTPPSDVKPTGGTLPTVGTPPSYIKPTGGTPPTDIKPTPLEKCDMPYNCQEPIFCEGPNYQTPQGYPRHCLCDIDIEGKPVCWQNTYCENLGHSISCTSNADCGPASLGLACVRGGECCGFGDKAFCVMKCKTPGNPYHPTWNSTVCNPAAASYYC